MLSADGSMSRPVVLLLLCAYLVVCFLCSQPRGWRDSYRAMGRMTKETQTALEQHRVKEETMRNWNGDRSFQLSSGWFVLTAVLSVITVWGAVLSTLFSTSIAKKLFALHVLLGYPVLWTAGSLFESNILGTMESLPELSPLQMSAILTAWCVYDTWWIPPALFAGVVLACLFLDRQITITSSGPPTSGPR